MTPAAWRWHAEIICITASRAPSNAPSPPSGCGGPSAGMIPLNVADSVPNVVDALARSAITTWNPSPPPPSAGMTIYCLRESLNVTDLPAPGAGRGIRVEHDVLHLDAAHDRLDVAEREPDPGLLPAQDRDQPGQGGERRKG